MFLNKDKFLNNTTDKNEQTENTNNNTNNDTNSNANNNNDTNTNIDNNDQLENSKKTTFIDIAKSYANAARTLWTAEGFTCNNVLSTAVDDGDYYVLIDTRDGAREKLPILIDEGGKSPWNNNDVQGYVRINIETNDGNRTPKFYISLTDGTNTIVDNNTVTSNEIQIENIITTTDLELLNKVKMTTDNTDDSGKHTGTADCTWDATNNKYACTNFTGYGPEAIDKMKAICIES